MKSNNWTPIRSLNGLGLMGIFALRHRTSGKMLICGSGNMYKQIWQQTANMAEGIHFNPTVARDLQADGPAAFEFLLIQDKEAKPLAQEGSLLEMLFREPLGQTMLMGAVVLQVIGFFWIRQVVRIEV